MKEHPKYWDKPASTTIGALIVLGLLAFAGILRYWGRYEFQEGQRSVYEAYSHGQIVAYEETREVFLVGKNGLPNIQLLFGLFKRPVINSNQVITIEDTEDQLPKVGKVIKTSSPVLQRDSKTYSDGTPVPERKTGQAFIPPTQ